MESQYARHASEESFAIAAAQRSLEVAKKVKLKEVEELYLKEIESCIQIYNTVSRVKLQYQV